jgi:hypothetical protein
MTLEERVARLEEELAIYRLVAAYGPAIDAGDTHAADLWAEDGTYDTYPTKLTGRAAIASMVLGDLHQSLLQRGCAHIQSFPRIRIDGETATATLHSLLLLNDGEDGFRIWRAAANRWELHRTAAGGWEITSRVNRLLDGSPEARELLS